MLTCLPWWQLTAELWEKSSPFSRVQPDNHSTPVWFSHTQRLWLVRNLTILLSQAFTWWKGEPKTVGINILIAFTLSSVPFHSQSHILEMCSAMSSSLKTPYGKPWPHWEGQPNKLWPKAQLEFTAGMGTQWQLTKWVWMMPKADGCLLEDRKKDGVVTNTCSQWFQIKRENSAQCV